MSSQTCLITGASALNGVQLDADLDFEYVDNPLRVVYKDLDAMSLEARLWHARFAPTVGAYGPTPSQRESLRIARGVYDEVAGQLTELVDNDYAELKAAMDAARVPWTPGRGIQK